MNEKSSPSAGREEKNLAVHLQYLKLPYIRNQFEPAARQAVSKQWSHVHYLANLIEGEVLQRQDRTIQRLVKKARFPVIKTLDQFHWNWPEKISRMQIQNLFRLAFIDEKANVILLGGVGLGKTHLAIAMGHAACLAGYAVLFTTAIEAINALVAAQAAGRLGQELAKYSKPKLLILDELGYLPIDKTGADLLFQIISNRYERGSMIITTNRAFKDWTEVFNNDATLTSAILDRVLHHAEPVVIEGKSYRMKEKIKE
ncbi:MAG: ATP-binding protein [Magnetococcales bacterium]|nr:ATP-binding protein [Magnetococcales bacterium]